MVTSDQLVPFQYSKSDDSLLTAKHFAVLAQDTSAKVDRRDGYVAVQPPRPFQCSTRLPKSTMLEKLPTAKQLVVLGQVTPRSWV